MAEWNTRVKNNFKKEQLKRKLLNFLSKVVIQFAKFGHKNFNPYSDHEKIKIFFCFFFFFFFFFFEKLDFKDSFLVKGTLIQI